MTAVFSMISTLVTNAIGWMGDFADEIVSNNILALFVIAIPLVGLGVGLLKRLIRVR